MAKKPKSEQIKNSTYTDAKKPLNEQELYNVLEFAQAYYTQYTRGDNRVDQNWAYTPQLTNERLASITNPTNNPKTWNDIGIDQAVANPTINQETLVGYSEFLQLTDTVASRTANYLGNLPTFDYIITCNNASADEYESKEYKEDWNRVKEFFTRFNPKHEFTKVNRRTVQAEAFFGLLNKDAYNYVFQELPRANCLITGKSADWGFVFDFNMEWFLKQGLSLNQYPSNFKKLWYAVFEGDKAKAEKYDPANPINDRNAIFATWSQTSPLPDDGNFVCFKFNSDIYATIPFLTSLFGDAKNKPLVRALQANQYIIASSKILVGLIPLLKEQKSGQVKDALAVSPTVMGQFLGLLKQGLPEAIKISGVPFSDVKDINFSLSEKNIYDEQNKAIAASSGVTSRFVYATDKMTAAEVKYNAWIDEMIATKVYPQYSVWVSSMINWLTKKYKFTVTFNGTYFDKTERLDRVERLANRGIFIDQLYANAMGMNVFELHTLMEMSNKSEFYDLLRLPPNSNVASNGDTVSGGRSKKGATEVAESTERDNDYEGGE